MAYDLDFSEQAQKDVQLHRKAGNKIMLKKILVLFNELTEHPFEGTGKPEPLKHQLTGIGLVELTKNIELFIK